MSKNRICMQPMRDLAYTQMGSYFFAWGGGGWGSEDGFLKFWGSNLVPKFPMCCPRVFQKSTSLYPISFAPVLPFSPL